MGYVLDRDGIQARADMKERAIRLAAAASDAAEARKSGWQCDDLETPGDAALRSLRLG